MPHFPTATRRSIRPPFTSVYAQQLYITLREDVTCETRDIWPKSAKGDKEFFLTMGYNLRTHARSLKLIVETLNACDSGQAQGGKLNMNYLRNSATAHFGEMVTTCVAHHNQFRRRMLEKRVVETREVTLPSGEDESSCGRRHRR